MAVFFFPVKGEATVRSYDPDDSSTPPWNTAIVDPTLGWWLRAAISLTGFDVQFQGPDGQTDEHLIQELAIETQNVRRVGGYGIAFEWRVRFRDNSRPGLAPGGGDDRYKAVVNFLVTVDY